MTGRIAGSANCTLRKAQFQATLSPATFSQRSLRNHYCGDSILAFELRGIVLALFPTTQLARDGNAEPEPPGGGGIRFTIGVMVDAADEVDRLTQQMRPSAATSWGCRGHRCSGA